VLIIGDTPYDVDCAAANGCRCLAVATGWSSAEELATAGADRVVSDLTGTSSIVDWVLDGVATSR
jgi:phosphoglycolate phosphatase-like HAD superfamily hydrolase